MAPVSADQFRRTAQVIRVSVSQKDVGDGQTLVLGDPCHSLGVAPRIYDTGRPSDRPLTR